MSFRNKMKHGFSLIETVIYVAMLAALSILIFNTIIIVFSSFAKARLEQRIALDAETALERISRETRLASSVNGGQSVLGVNPSTLVLNSVKSAVDLTPSAKKIFVSGGRVAFQENSGEAVYLTSPKSSVTQFLISKINTAESEAVKISITLESSLGRASSTSSFYNTLILRRNY